MYSYRQAAYMHAYVEFKRYKKKTTFPRTSGIDRQSFISADRYKIKPEEEISSPIDT